MDRAFFIRKVENVEQLRYETNLLLEANFALGKQYIITKKIVLDELAFKGFSSNILGKWVFVQKNSKCCYAKNNIWYCLLLVNNKDQILVYTDNEDYARFSALIL